MDISYQSARVEKVILFLIRGNISYGETVSNGASVVMINITKEMASKLWCAFYPSFLLHYVELKTQQYVSL